jgi:dipeptidyl aminopeptidase/acylaminoacyl peptidase
MPLKPESDAMDGGQDKIRDTFEQPVAWMARIGLCLSPSFSPNGKRIAFVSDLNGLPQVWTVATEGGWPELVTTLDDQVLQVSWSPDGTRLAFALAPGGGMNQQVYVCRPDGTEVRRLTDGGTENNLLGPWTLDGRMVSYSSNRREPGDMDIDLFDIETGERRPCVRNEGVGFSFFTDISRDRRWAVLYRMVNRSDDNLYLVNLETQAEWHLTPHTGPGNFSNGRFAPDGAAVYFASDKDRELAAFVRVMLGEDGRPGPVEMLALRDDAELERFEISRDGSKAALVWNVAGRNELAFYNLAARELSPGLELPGELLSELTFSSDGRWLAMTIAGSTKPTDIWVLDCQTMRLRQVTHSPHAGVNLDRLVRPTLRRFRAHDGLEMSGWLYVPHGFVTPGPLVLWFHGGPEAQERPDFNSLFQALLNQGIAVFAPNVRGSSGFGKTFVNLDNGALRFNAIKDIRSCVEDMVSAGVADEKRVGIIGPSYGGYMTMAGLVEYPELFAAGVNIYGVVNFETFFAHTEPWMAAISKIEYGDPETELELLRRLSPIHKADRVRAATLVIHGANDTNVPVVEAEQVVDSLKSRAVAVKYVLFPDEGHGIRKVSNRIRAWSEIVGWFVEHLKN